MPTHLHSGPARVLTSGQVTTFFGHPLVLGLDLPEGPLVVRFSFRADPASPAPRVDAATLPDGWSFDLVNFDGADGRGSAEPVLLGAFGDDLIFLHFRTFRFGETPDRTVHYTAFRVAQADIGWQPTPED